ncbi:uncharacterized protein J7T54_008229 [Emericellopsis cladophorae]|uniref:MARVEL domain-containing protein n=1 Tax=Emericellopsis cladophorae TaxID=2686198 RepID=A0A9P9XXS9_9HYPO|nr:uncharacterized protein J7T54_008229 [Emericellopsis cladophorae]KAI6779611.1 hypothetical protein J7T54_008229 [Emericellopsis cladophorae]
MPGRDEKRRPAALNLTPTRTGTSDSSSSDNSLKPRTPRFVEATTVHSPIEAKSPFADPEKSHMAQAQPGDIGFGYLNNRESVAVPMTPKTPLKSAMKVPGTPARKFDNPLSPTFREDILEKQESATDKEQARDVKIKARVRLAKVALRGVNFSCALIILAMLSSSFAIFNATKSLPSQSKMPAWAEDTKIWPQVLVLVMACLTLGACIVVFCAYFRGGHKRAEKVATYYTMFALGWFIMSMVLWAITAALFQNSRNNSGNKDMWGWSCVQNTRSAVYGDKVDYQLICRLQNWTLICIIIEIVIEVICITLYSIVFYRYYTKRRLAKSMDLRDRARSDLYLAQLRSQSAPNTPGFGPKSPALSQYAMSPRHPPAAFRNLADIEESPFTPGGRVAEPSSQFSPSQPQSGFVLQAPPVKAPSATPKTKQAAFAVEEPVRQPSPPQIQVQPPAAVVDDEPVYDAVPIPGAYAGQAIKSPPPNQVAFGQAS